MAMAQSASKRRSFRQAASRKRSPYVDPDTDDDFQADAGSEDDVAAAPAAELPTPPRKRRKTAGSRRSKPQTRSRAKVERSKPRNTVRAKTKKPIRLKRKPRKTHEQILKEREFRGPSDGRIPDWCSLPPSILRDVFIFASQPLVDDNNDSSNAVWLLKAAQTCRSFSEPALEAYYQAPAMHHPDQPHHLLSLLMKASDKRYINYNVKVQRLNVDVRALAYQAAHKGAFDVNALIPELPQLQHLEISHPIDRPPFRPLKIQKWVYPSILFHGFEIDGRRLRTWRWTRDMMAQPQSTLYQYLTKLHSSAVFTHLEALTVCGFDANDSAPQPPPRNVDIDMPTPPDLASSLQPLMNLRDLTFISCGLVNGALLAELPKQLHRLRLSNCREFNSDMLAVFLQDGGSQLRVLELYHNPALDLAFLPSLKTTCPKLEVLKVDFSFFSELSTVNDAEPLFDYLLTEDEIPTWPTTLQHLELVHLQKFEADAARNFFGSLVDSAHELPDLRQLIVHSHINVPWRDRAGFRDEWIDRLQRVYLRKWSDPLPYLGSLRQFRLWKQSQVKSNGDTFANDGHGSDEPGVRRRLAHVQVTPRKPRTGETDIEDDVEEQAPLNGRQPRRSRRVAEGQASASATSAPESESSESEDTDDGEELYVQGLCEVVDIRIDNQRPRENQFTEGDFLDSEQSGDEDWHEGADDLDGHDGYAW